MRESGLVNPVYSSASPQLAWEAWQAASAERDAAPRQMAVLRGVLEDAVEGSFGQKEWMQAKAALADTEAAAQAYEREVTNRVLEEVASKADDSAHNINHCENDCHCAADMFKDFAAELRAAKKTA